jgi:S1-C subfamily serine protease
MTTRWRSSNLASGVLGGVVAVVIGAILLATGAIHTGGDKTVVEQVGSSSARPAAQISAGGHTIGQIYKQVSPGVAFIQSKVTQQSSNPFGFPDQQQGLATGSGFVIDKRGYVVTNAHVIDGATPGTVQVSFLSGQPVPAKIVGKDVSSDLAVLKVDPSKVKLVPLELGDSSKVQVGDPAIAIGNPFGYDDTVTSGIISALQRHIQAPNNFSIDNVLQTDAAINPGNSGGPLLNASGQVIGINSQIATNGQSNGNVGIGFAVPINLAKQIVPKLISNGSVQHPYLGITTASVAPPIAQDLHLPVNQGALVQDVVQGGPADKAGLQAGNQQTPDGVTAGGDLIVGLDGKPIKKPDDIATAIANDKPGQQVKITFYRGSSKRTVTVTLGNRPQTAPSDSGSQGGGGGGGLLPQVP